MIYAPSYNVDYYNQPNFHSSCFLNTYIISYSTDRLLLRRKPGVCRIIPKIPNIIKKIINHALLKYYCNSGFYFMGLVLMQHIVLCRYLGTLEERLYGFAKIAYVWLQSYRQTIGKCGEGICMRISFQPVQAAAEFSYIIMITNRRPGNASPAALLGFINKRFN